MSDLAPFVAAVLRDKVITDQLEEVKDLQRQLKRARQVTIVNCGTVFAEAQLEDGYAIGPTRWNVEFQEVPCQISSLRLAELRVGGVTRADVVGSADETFVEEYDEEKMRAQMSALYSPGLWLTFLVGPLSRNIFEEFHDMPAQGLFEHLILRSQDQPQMRLYWKSVLFSGGSANAALSDISDQN